MRSGKFICFEPTVKTRAGNYKKRYAMRHRKTASPKEKAALKDHWARIEGELHNRAAFLRWY
jgi:hypothetical protein